MVLKEMLLIIQQNNNFIDIFRTIAPMKIDNLHITIVRFFSRRPLRA